jgi:hypothetical protein
MISTCPAHATKLAVSRRARERRGTGARQAILPFAAHMCNAVCPVLSGSPPLGRSVRGYAPPWHTGFNVQSNSGGSRQNAILGIAKAVLAALMSIGSLHLIPSRQRLKRGKSPSRAAVCSGVHTIESSVTDLPDASVESAFLVAHQSSSCR